MRRGGTASLYRPSAKMPRKFVGQISSWVEYYGERGVVYGSGLDIIQCYQKIKLSCHSMVYQIGIAMAGKIMDGNAGIIY